MIVNDRLSFLDLTMEIAKGDNHRATRATMARSSIPLISRGSLAADRDF